MQTALFQEKMWRGLQPDVNVTLWGEWITATLFHADHYATFADFISELLDDCNADCTFLPSAFGEILKRQIHKTRLCECDFLHSCHELSIYKEREQGEGVHTRTRITHVCWKFSVAVVRGNQNFDFFF